MRRLPAASDGRKGFATCRNVCTVAFYVWGGRPADAPHAACSATKEGTVVLSAPVAMGLDDCLEYIAADELVEVRTPPRVERVPRLRVLGFGLTP